MENKAYSFFEVKAIDSERRRFTGIATTPTMDRVGDTINPLGVTFKNPLVLLHQHKHDKPIGTVVFKKPTKNGIEFEAEIPVVDEESSFKDRVDTAWAEIKHGVVRAVSVGFRSVKHAYRDDGGIDFHEVEVFELSTVSVPANAQAIITSIKGMDDNANRKRVLALNGAIPLLSKTHEGSVKLFNK